MTSTEILNDEELLLAARLGDHKAESLFAERFFKERVRNCYSVANEACRMLDDWDLNEAYFHAYTSSVSGYRFGSVRFRTYFLSNLYHAIIHKLSKKIKEESDGGRVLSLDAKLLDENETVYSLSDFVASDNFMDDPRSFLLYAERLEDLNHLPKGSDPMMLDAVRLVTADYSFAEAAKLCGVSENRIKYLISRYRRWASKSMRLILKFGKKK